MTVIKVENISKQYRLGQVGSVSIKDDIKRYWAKAMGKEDPLLMLGVANTLNQAVAENEYIWALKDINFEVKEGEILGIIGKNGAGKSTLLKILSRITAPTKGQIKVKGRIASLLEVGTGFHPELTGRENIYLNGAILGMSNKEIDFKLDEIITFSGVEKYIDTPVKRYSSGMYVRLAFAVAAHLESEILVLDEVLAVGDAEFQNKCLGKMGDVAKDGRTVIFVSHNMEAVRNLCGRTILVDKGEVAFNGLTHETIDVYNKKNIYLNQTIKSIDKNIIENNIISKFKNYEQDQDIELDISILSEKEFDNVEFDFAIYKHKENYIIHGKSVNKNSFFTINKDKKFEFSINIKSPFLSSGDYFMTIYIHRFNEVLVWKEDIRIFSISRNNQNIDNSYSNSKGIIEPDFKINIL